MATTDFGVNLAEVQKYQPDIASFGITDFDTQLQFAEDDVIRQIREEWWERYRHTVRYKDITKITSLELVNSKLTDALYSFPVNEKKHRATNGATGSEGEVVLLSRSISKAQNLMFLAGEAADRPKNHILGN